MYHYLKLLRRIPLRLSDNVRSAHRSIDLKGTPMIRANAVQSNAGSCRNHHHRRLQWLTAPFSDHPAQNRSSGLSIGN
jgi:hypothetical protein